MDNDIVLVGTATTCESRLPGIHEERVLIKRTPRIGEGQAA